MKDNSVGIVGYGAYIPRFYMDPAELNSGAQGLGLEKKALALWDEDSVTMAVEAGREALRTAAIEAGDLGAVYVGSESPPYAVNPMSTIVADVLGVGNPSASFDGAKDKRSGQAEYRAVDLQFACKAATAGLQMAMGEVASGHHHYGLVIGSDKAQAKPGDVLESSAGAAAAALVVGRGKILARVLGTLSVTSDTPDFWRRGGQQYPQHGGRFTGEPAYFAHVVTAGKKLLQQMEFGATDLTYAVFHMPNGRFPLEAGKRLGFTASQIEPFMTIREVGNPYSASALLGMVALLEVLQPWERALIVAYGSGAGADAILLEGTEELKQRRWGGLKHLFNGRSSVGLVKYLRHERWE
jgi:hydroxymethylglutaryl-CoA synthase